MYALGGYLHCSINFGYCHCLSKMIMTEFLDDLLMIIKFLLQVTYMPVCSLYWSTKSHFNESTYRKYEVFSFWLVLYVCCDKLIDNFCLYNYFPKISAFIHIIDKGHHGQ